MPILSIIIPTSNRRDILEKSLKVLLERDPLQDCEVIIVDRPMDDTRQMVESLARLAPIRYLEQHGQGRPAARNIGIKASEAEILLFLDDDILVEKGFIEEHTRYHQGFPGSACLGKTVNKTDSKDLFVDYLVNYSTFLTAYSLIKDPEDLSFNLFYTSNISLKREEIIEVAGFDEDFTMYGLEDIEFGYRWKRSGRKIRYNAGAVGYHYYDTTRVDFLARRYEVGQAAALFYHKHKDRDVADYLHIDVASSLTQESEVIIEKAKWIIETIEGLPLKKDVFGIKGIREALHSCYSLLIAYHYYLGLKDGLKR